MSLLMPQGISDLTAAQAGNSEDRFYANPPAQGFNQTPFKTIGVTGFSYNQVVSFGIVIGYDAPMYVVYTYHKVATTPVAEITSWAGTQSGFGAAVASSYETYPNWSAGWTLDSMKFEFQGGGQATVFMAYQNSVPNTLFMEYFDPVTGKLTSWVTLQIN